MRQIQNTQNIWLPELINGLFDTDILPYSGWVARAKATTPAVNVIESDKDYVLELAAPGMGKQDFCIKINEDNNLVIKMEKTVSNSANEAENASAENNATSSEAKADAARYIRREFAYSKYEQTFVMPEDVERKDIRAKVENGILTVTLPKIVVEEEPKVVTQIAID